MERDEAALDRHYDFMVTARRYARAGNVPLTQLYLERASRIKPISDLRIWGLKQILGYKFEELDLDRVRIVL